MIFAKKQHLKKTLGIPLRSSILSLMPFLQIWKIATLSLISIGLSSSHQAYHENADYLNLIKMAGHRMALFLAYCWRNNFRADWHSKRTSGIKSAS